MITLHEFYQYAETRTRLHLERRGQACFNILAEIRPALAEKIRGTNLDPFYTETGSPVWKAFTEWLERNW